ncbi:hypothetical protein CK203_051124 [Vitis vinifera]|uniref:Retrovirus-related Pol polyprotein from transposon TNT 1-94 n=1 Tax=Vitis vinifera TaxID=29760 RepID=A0A438FW03_VITVI|nr:hypothetical protein CK203_051124 [Vitis vinifera]
MITCLELARYTNNPAKEHWFALVRVLRYLKHTVEYGLQYTRGGAISWKSSKQTCIARLTMESEFIALDKAEEEAEWL